MSLFLLLGCPAADTGKDDTGPVETDADTDTDSDTDTDTDSDTDSDTDTDTDTAEVTLLGIAFTTGFAELSTRDVLAPGLTASWSDGTASDVAMDATWSSSAPEVIEFYTPGAGQPIGAGVATVTASYGGFDVMGDVSVTVVAAMAGDLVFNEVLADGTVDGDPNGDGNTDSIEDEFLEIANYSDVTVDLSGATLIEDDFPYLPRHTFAAGTLLRAGEAIVVFGGGDVSALTGANVVFLVCENEDPGLQYGLSLNNEGETVLLVGADGSTLATFTYGEGTDLEAIEDASMVLSPDVWGTDYTHHGYATGSIGDFSPGTWTDGTQFGGPASRY